MLTIITVNFNNAAATVALLRSLEKQTDRDFATCVVDNASEPQDRARLGEYAATSPLALDVLYSPENRGFAGGNNLAIRKTMEQGDEWFVLLNNDTTVPPDFVATLKPQLGRQPAVVGIPLEERTENGERRTAYAGVVQWFKATLPHLPAPPSSLLPPPSPLYAIGAAMAVPRTVFERIGLMDERYFLYFEDAEFSLRARRAGIPVRFLQEPVVRHAVSASTSRLGSPLLLHYHARNALLFNRTCGPWWVRASLPLASGYGIVIQLLKLLLMPSRRAPSRAILDGILDFHAHRFGKIEGHRHRMRGPGRTDLGHGPADPQAPGGPGRP